MMAMVGLSYFVYRHKCCADREKRSTVYIIAMSNIKGSELR